MQLLRGKKTIFSTHFYHLYIILYIVLLICYFIVPFNYSKLGFNFGQFQFNISPLLLLISRHQTILSWPIDIKKRRSCSKIFEKVIHPLNSVSQRSPLLDIQISLDKIYIPLCQNDKCDRRTQLTAHISPLRDVSISIRFLPSQCVTHLNSFKCIKCRRNIFC